MQRTAVLAQRKVERGRVKRPAPPRTEGFEYRLICKEIQPVDVGAKLGQCPGPGQVRGAGALKCDVVMSEGQDVLTLTFLTAAAQADDGCQPFEAKVL